MPASLVSVIIPAFNGEATIRRAVESVLAQTHRPLEIVVVDDGSTDGTSAVLVDFGPTVRCLRQPNAGPSAARNHGVRASRGEIVSFLDADDFWRPEKLARQVAQLHAGGETVVCCVCDAALRQADGTTFSSYARAGLPSVDAFWLNPGEVLATRFLLFNQVVAVRRAAFEAAGGFNESFRLLEDLELALRLSRLGPWGIVSGPLVVKDNGTAGVGVRAMRDPAVHSAATRQVVEHLLVHTFPADETPPNPVRPRLLRTLRDTRTEEAAWGRLTSPSLRSRSAGRLGLGVLRVRKALRRRLPGWPAVETCDHLDAPRTLAAAPPLAASA